VRVGDDDDDDGDDAGGGGGGGRAAAYPLRAALALVGPHGADPTLQARLDRLDRSEPSETARPDVLVLDPTVEGHNGNLVVRRRRVRINAMGARLFGTVEITDDCEELVLENAHADALALVTTRGADDAPPADAGRPLRLELRGVRGSLRDCNLCRARGTLRIAHSQLVLLNALRGDLRAVEVAFSHLEGAALRMGELTRVDFVASPDAAAGRAADADAT